MRFGIERHRSRTALSLQSLENCQFVWRFFFRDCRRAVSTRSKRELRCVIERTAVDSCANRNSIDDFSAFRIEHDHHFVVTAREQTMMLRIQSDSTWSFARRKRPVRDDFMFIRIDYSDFALIFDIAVNAPRCFIHHCKFWISSERNRRRDASVFRVDNGDRISSVIEDIDLTMTWFVNDGVWILPCINFRSRLQRC